jgi:hypothetical protein
VTLSPRTPWDFDRRSSGTGLCPPVQSGKTRFELNGNTLFEPYIVLPVVVEIILIQKAFTKTKTELGQPNAVWVIGEGEASLVRNAVIFAVDVKTMKWESLQPMAI